MTREEERILRGVLFAPGDPELRAIKRRAHDLNQDYNSTYESETEKRTEILNKLLGSIGEGTFLQGPITFHYGTHTHIGNRVFINFNFTVQDDAPVTIGDDCNFGPNCTIVTPQHPLLPEERKKMLDAEGKPARLCYAEPVTIGSDCWFGANVVICPGVTIGSGCVIGAGSVVTKDIPDHCVAAGVPCRVLRELSEKDSMKYLPEKLGGCSVIE